MSATVVKTVCDGALALLSDGTMQTKRAVYALDPVTRLVVANLFSRDQKRGGWPVEVELRHGRVLVGSVQTVARSHGGGADTLVMRIDGETFDDAFSLATVRSITQLTHNEHAKRVHS